MKFLILLVIILSSPAYSQTRNFCERNRQDILSIMQEPTARIAFKNTGGIANGGVCWWHSRLQRSSFFLVKYAPESSRPDQKKLNEILAGLRTMDQVVTIPGYADFQSFTRSHQKQLQRLLNDWQLFDDLYNFQWLRRISGKPVLPADELVARMNTVYEAYRNSPASMWIMAQMEGITSHSFLVVHMEKVNGGYDLDLIDSNHPMEVVKVAYHEGDQTLRSNRSKNHFVPYVGFQEDFRKISKGLVGHCRNKSIELLQDFSDIRDGEVELPNPVWNYLQ